MDKVLNVFDKLYSISKNINPFFMIVIAIIHFTINLNQEDFCNILDNLSKNMFVDEKLIVILDKVFFNCLFFSLAGLVMVYILRRMNTDNTSSLLEQSDAYYHLRVLFLKFKTLLKVSLPFFYITHILLFYKLFITDFLLSVTSYFTGYHFLFLIFSIILMVLLVAIHKLRETL